MSCESERVTRKRRIDKLLRDTGWQIIPYDDGMDLSLLTNHAIEEFPTRNGPVDYALVVQGRLLGVLEAKKPAVGAENVPGQAKRYAQGVDTAIGSWNGYHVPFLYSSNGELIFHLDVRKEQHLDRQLFRFPTPEALHQLFERDDRHALQWLHGHPGDNPCLRDYQKDANQSFERETCDP